MSLNADVDQEFGPIDASDAQTLAAVPQNTEGTATVTPETLFDGTVTNGELPTLDKDFEIQTQASNRLIDLQHFHQQLRVSGAISLEDAQAIDAVAPGFINDDTNPAGYYTEAATKTNFNESLNTLSGELDRQYEEAKTTLGELASRTAALGKDALRAMRPKYVECLTGINKAILSLLVASDKELVEQVPFFFGKDCRWSKLCQVSIFSLIDGGDFGGGADNALVAAARASSFGTYVDRFEEVLKLPDNRNNITDWLTYEYPVLWINRTRFKFGEGGLLVQDKDTATEVSCQGATTLGAVFHQIGTSRVRDWVVQLQNTYQTYVGLAEQIPAQLQELDNQEAVLSAKLDRVIELSGVLNETRNTLMGINNALGALFAFMCVSKDLIADINKAF